MQATPWGEMEWVAHTKKVFIELIVIKFLDELQ